MQDDDLRKIYQEQSNEQTPKTLDQAILEQAKQAVTDGQQSKHRSWQPKLATAASVFVIVLLVVQFQSLYWDSNSPQSTLPNTSPESFQDATQADKATKTEPIAVESAMMEHSEHDREQAAISESQKKYKSAPKVQVEQLLRRKQGANEEQRRQTKASQAERKQTTDEATLRAIQQLLKNGDLDTAKKEWQKIKEKYPTVPESEPLKSLYLALEPAFR